jgi:hypothetical protein
VSIYFFACSDYEGFYDEDQGSKSIQSRLKNKKGVLAIKKPKKSSADVDNRGFFFVCLFVCLSIYNKCCTATSSTNTSPSKKSTSRVIESQSSVKIFGVFVNCHFVDVFLCLG